MVDLLNDVLKSVARIQADVYELSRPPSHGKEPRTRQVLEPDWFKPKYGRLIPLVNQINGTYENGWYDACAAMLRRLIETMIIKIYVAKKIEGKIKQNDEYLQLSEIIERACQEPFIDFSKDNKRILRDIPKLGNTAAHNRVIYLRRDYLENRIVEVQFLVQHLIEI